MQKVIKMKALRIIALAAALALAKPAMSDDIFKGRKGPTDVQLDLRAGLIRNEAGIETLANTLIMKYWPESASIWGFTATPYKFTNGIKGTGDLSVGAGPRIVINDGKLSFLPYVGAVLPTGQLSNRRFDEIIGFHGTYLAAGNKFEADVSAQYTFAGKKDGAEQPNEWYVGALAGGGSAKIRGIAGITHLQKTNRDSLTRLRAVGRYTFSKNMHLELAIEKGIASRNILKDYSAAVYFRWNIPNSK
jgi:hypothetical protein